MKGPMYSSDLSTDSGPLQQYIEPLLKKYNVDLAMWGHMHCYERTYPGMYLSLSLSLFLSLSLSLSLSLPIFIYLYLGGAGGFILGSTLGGALGTGVAAAVEAGQNRAFTRKAVNMHKKEFLRKVSRRSCQHCMLCNSQLKKLGLKWARNCSMCG